MIYYFALAVLLALVIWFLRSYWREIKFRKKPFYTLSEIGWRTKQPPPLSDRIHSMALVGDIGNAGPPDQDPVLKILQNWMQEAGTQSSLLFLGDNIYPVGLPPVEHRHYKPALQKLQHQLDALKNFSGKVIYISGNHDWNKGRKSGYSYLKRQEEYITGALNDPEAYQPKNGCLGPVTWEINGHVILVVINTQWWVQTGIRPLGAEYSCSYSTPDDFFVEFEKILVANKEKFIVIAAHHPLYSNAMHGGNFTVRQSLFPLTAYHKKALIPLPFTGFLYTSYRRWIGAAEDISFPPFRRFRKKLLKILKKYDNHFYVGGHEHNLQLFIFGNRYYAVSGSGSKTAYVTKGGKAAFTHESKGFMVLDQYTNGEVWLRVLEPDTSSNTLDETTPLLIFQKCLYKAKTMPSAPLS